MIEDTTALDEALDIALNALNQGTRPDIALALIPEHADQVRPLLETAARARRDVPGSLTSLSMSPALAAGWRNVQMELEAARGGRPEVGSHPSWWKRRLRFASLSLPVVVVLGVSGAAAAAAAAGATGALPESVANIVPFVGDDHADVQDDAFPPASGIERGDGNADEANGAAGETPGSENSPVLRVLDGDVSDINGNTFTLTDGEDTWKVNLDGNTEVSGEVSDGAEVTVEGDVTAEKNLHARKLHVTKPGNGNGRPLPAEDAPRGDGDSRNDDDSPAVGPGGDGVPGPATTPGPPENPGGGPTDGDGPPHDSGPPGEDERGRSDDAPGHNKDDD